MLMNLNEMKKAEVITVHNGILQAINGPIAYIGYLDNFAGTSFSVDAETLASALKDLDDDFMVRVYADKVIVFDSEREITFLPKDPEQLIKIPTGSWYMRDISYAWQTVDKFVNQQFPGVKFTKGYFETLSDQSIVRVNHYLDLDELQNTSYIFAKCKVPPKIVAFLIHDNKLWLQYKDSNFIIINTLDVAFPATDNFFENTLRYAQIPDIKKKLIPCDRVQFKDNSLILIKDDAAQAIIEGVQGKGTYDFKLFTKVINSAFGWQMTDTALFFMGENFKGLIENVEHSTV